MNLKTFTGGKKGATPTFGAADSGSLPLENTQGYEASAVNAPNITTAKALKKDILAPRFYTTNFDEINSWKLPTQNPEFQAILKEFRDDYNKGHFVRTPEFAGPHPNLPEQEFEEFASRSAMGEFSGCLLYREISQKATDPYIKEVFKLITRDEGRHASFLTHTMKDLNINFDLGFLAQEKERTKIPPKIMCITVYLSEIIGYYRYITIFDHLEANPHLRFHPIFKAFGRWCNDEHRHGHFFAMIMKAQSKSMLQGPLNHAMIRFFTMSVYITMYLRDIKPAAQTFYRQMGLVPRDYDLHVIKRCDEEASTVWGFKFQVEHPTFVRQLDKMAENNQKLEKLEGKKGLQVTLQRTLLKANNVGRIFRLFAMKTVKV